MADVGPPRDVTVGERLVIEGGALKDSPWVPHDVVVVDGQHFVPIHRADRKFQRFVLGSGSAVSASCCPFGDNVFFDRFRNKRNAAVDAAILAHVKAEDQYFSASVVSKTVRATVDVGVLPHVVVISLPTVTFEANGEKFAYATMTVKCITDMQRNRVVSVEATPTVLGHIRAAVLKAASVAVVRRVRKREASIDVRGVFSDKRRKALWTHIPASLGLKMKRLRMKPDVWDEFHRNQCAIALQAKLADMVEVWNAAGGERNAEEADGHAVTDGGADEESGEEQLVDDDNAEGEDGEDEDDADDNLRDDANVLEDGDTAAAGQGDV